MTRLPRRALVFGLLTAGLLAGAAPVIHALASLARSDDTASHTIAVPAVVAWLLYLNRAAVLADTSVSRAAVLGGLVLGVSGLACIALAWPATASYDGLTLGVFGVVVAWYGVFLASVGGNSVRAALFPLAFLLLTVPMPSVVLEAATRVLKDGSTEGVAALFSLTGTPYLREGYVFALPGAAIEVADECSGIRSSIGLLLTTLLAGHFFLRRGWSMAALLLVVLPVAIVKNAVRISALSILAIRVDPGYLTGQLHHEGGVVFFLLGLGLLAPVLIVLRRLETPRSEPMVVAQRA